MQRLGGIADWLGATLLGVLLILGVVALVDPSIGGQTQTILSTVSPPVTHTFPPFAVVLSVEGTGAIRAPIWLTAGSYFLHWEASAGDRDCDFRLVLDGPAGSVVVDDYGTIAAHTSSLSGEPLDVVLEEGSYRLVADTDCLGPVWLRAGRYLSFRAQ
jgi:hypothetical protein